MEFEIPFMHISNFLVMVWYIATTLHNVNLKECVCDFVEKCPKKLLEKIFFYVVESWNLKDRLLSNTSYFNFLIKT